MLEAARARWRASRDEVAARWGRFCLLTLLALTGYATFVFSMAALNIGGLPNYYIGFHALEGLVDTFTLSMPLWGRYDLVAGQPLIAFGYRHPVMGTLEGLYILTIQALFNFLLMSALIALYGLFMSRALPARGVTPKTLTSFILGGSGSAVGVLTAGAATVACCGGSGVSVVLSLLGVGAGAGLFLAEHERAFGALGLALMLVNIWIAAGWIVSTSRSAPNPSSGACIRRLVEKTSA